MPTRFATISLFGFILAVGGCARSGAGNLDEETQKKLTQASDDAASALAGVKENSTRIDWS